MPQAPGIYFDTPAFCSKYYVWFKELGYPQLDIRTFEDGEWSIIEMYNAPVVPGLTQWKDVLAGMRNTEISFDFVKKYVEFLDLTKTAYWDHERRKSIKSVEEKEAHDKHAKELAERAVNIIGKHDHLKDRIARGGLKEALPWHIAKHIPLREFKPNFKSQRG